MLIQDMTRQMCMALLRETQIGHLACAQGAQPYVTPFAFACGDDYLYSFALAGMKIGWMRANPLVCVNAERIVTREDWRSVVIFGRYEELPDTPEFYEPRLAALAALAATANWWYPGAAKNDHRGAARPLIPVHFRISIDSITGHEGSPGDRPA